jgi:Putative Actinobacterial Holin-X, holin superfamily III
MSERFASGAVQDHPPDDPTQLPIGELVNRATEQVSRLIREEMELARLEMQEKIKHAGIGVGMFGAAGIVALFGLGALIATAILVLSTALAAWLAALIVAVVLFAGAGAMALAGKKQVAEGTPPVPEEAIESVHEDIDEIKARAQR